MMHKRNNPSHLTKKTAKLMGG